jgi:hypothetical protein
MDASEPPSSSSCDGTSRKRQGDELLEQRSDGSRAKHNDDCYQSFPTYQNLSAVQRAIIARIIGMLDTTQDSVVISNPQQPCSPIVYVTNAWQDMCGYRMSEAIGQNPRCTQGEHSDKDTIRGMGVALSNQQACRVRLINYRGGANHEPFWNCLSVRPMPLCPRRRVVAGTRCQDENGRRRHHGCRRHHGRRRLLVPASCSGPALILPPAPPSPTSRCNPSSSRAS